MSRRGLLLFLAVGVIWGLPYFMIRIAVRQLSPEFLVFARTLPAMLVLLPFALRTPGWRRALARWRAILIYTVGEFAIPWLLLFRAEQHLPSSLTGLFIATVPLIALILLKLTGETERIGTTRLAGILIGLGGVGVLVGLDLHGGDSVAFGELLITAVGYAVGPMMISRYLSELPPLIVVTLSLAIGSVLYAPFALTHMPSHFNAETTLSVAGLAFGCTAVGFLAFFALINEVGPARATVVTYINPAVAVLLGVLALHEKFTVGIAIGFPLVIAGSYFSTRAANLPAPTTG